MRILISPRPVTSYSVGIFLGRMAREFERRGLTTTSTLFHYTGVSLPPWDYGSLMGGPRHAFKVLSSGKPVVATMGQPTDKAWCDCGVPVVSPNYGGPAELMAPAGGVAVTGEPWIYDDSFCERMAEAVRRVKDDRAAFSSAARQAAERNDIGRTADAYLRFMNVGAQGGVRR